MDVGRSNSSGPLNAQQRYREAMADLLRRTRARVQTARQEVHRQGKEFTEARRAESIERKHVEPQPTRSQEKSAPESRAALPQRDRIDISDASLERINTLLGDEGHELSRPKLERLQRAYRSGTLNNPERMQRAAERILDQRPREIATGS